MKVKDLIAQLRAVDSEAFAPGHFIEQVQSWQPTSTADEVGLRCAGINDVCAQQRKQLTQQRSKARDMQSRLVELRLIREDSNYRRLSSHNSAT